MGWLRRIFNRSNDIDREIDDELRFHIETKIERYVHAGISAEQARQKAMERFGNLQQIREAVRDIETGVFESMWQDLRHSIRALSRNPGFATIAALSLALGIGLNSSVFSALNAVLLRPLPYADPDRVVRVYNVPNRMATFREVLSSSYAGTVSPALYSLWAEDNQAFQSLAVYESKAEALILTDGNGSERVRGVRVSAAFFSVLGAQPALGRAFLPEEDRPHSDVAVVSDAFRRRRWAADPSILGRTITLNDSNLRIIGVMSGDFRFPTVGGEPDIWLPYPFEDNPSSNTNPFTLSVVARLKDGISLAQAQAQMRITAGNAAKHYPNLKDFSSVVVPIADTVWQPARPAFLLLAGAVVLVLLIACANVAHLLLVRADTRQREMAIRASLGAGRRRLIRQLLTESCVLAGAGTAGGLLIAVWAGRLLRQLREAPSGLQSPGTGVFRLDQIGVDWRVAGFLLLLSLLTPLLFGLAPAIHSSRIRLIEALGEGRGNGTRLRRGARLRDLLVAGQIGLSLVLLAGTGLMLNSLWRLWRIPFGFQPEHVLVLHAPLMEASPYVTDLGWKRTSRTRQIHYWSLRPEAHLLEDRVVRGLEALPGVESAAAVAYSLPFTGIGWGVPMLPVEGRDTEPAGEIPRIWAVSPGYFRTMGIHLRQGRDFNDHDDGNALGVVIVSERYARTFWPGESNVLGKQVRLAGAPDGPVFQVVGLADDVAIDTNAIQPPEYYVPNAQREMASFNKGTLDARLNVYFVLRTRAPAALASAARASLQQTGRELAIDRIETMDDVVSASLGQWRTMLELLGLFAVVAVLLATVGIYGVVAYTVTQRTHEIGVRMAMGAGRLQILWLIMRNGLVLAVSGTAAGIAGSYGFTRLLSAQLYGISATDPLTFSAVTLILLAIALLSCYIPARRAIRLDPAVALRYD